MSRSRILVLLLIAGLIAAFFAFDLGRFFSLEYFKSQQQTISGWYRAHPGQTMAGFFLIYVAVTGLSLLSVLVFDRFLLPRLPRLRWVLVE